MSLTTSEMEALKSKLKATWMAGDFGLIAKYSESGAADFVRRLGLTPGMRVLDVACGTGNLSIPAAKSGATVTGLDIAPNLLDQARSRTQSEGLTAQFDEGDAEKLPYADSSFDAVISMFGAMFAPRPELVAAELLRVCRSGGTIAMANWTATGFVGQMFNIVSEHVPPPNIPSPIEWGDEETVRERLGSGADLCFTRRLISLHYPLDPRELVEFFRVYFGPTNRAFEALADSPEKQAHLRIDLEKLWSDYNKHSDGTTCVESEYLEVIATRH